MMSERNLLDNFLTALNGLTGKPIWSIISGPSTGAGLSLAVGGRRRRAKPLRNEHLSDIERTFEGEFGLYIECAWRLESHLTVVCGSGTAAATADCLELQQLRGATIDHVHLDRVHFDSVLRVAGGFVLRLFCDQVETDAWHDNYTL